jgi:hypothetical protein
MRVPVNMALGRPQFVDWGDGVQVCKVAVNIFNKQSRAADKDGPQSWGLGVGLTTTHCKIPACYEINK